METSIYKSIFSLYGKRCDDIHIDLLSINISTLFIPALVYLISKVFFANILRSFIFHNIIILTLSWLDFSFQHLLFLFQYISIIRRTYVCTYMRMRMWFRTHAGDGREKFERGWCCHMTNRGSIRRGRLRRRFSATLSNKRLSEKKNNI